MFDELDIEKRLTALEIRVEKLEDIVEEIRNLSTSMTEMCSEIKHLSGTVNRLDVRVQSIESQPADAWKTIRTVIITAIVSGLIGIAIKSLFP